MTPVRLTSHPAHRYALDVTRGRVVTGEWVALACERYLRDRRDAKRLGIHFDRDAAQRILDFFPRFLRHSKGEWAGQPFELEPWQQFRLWNVFGWKRADGTRRFRTAYTEVARKNGKTTECAGVGLYLTSFDGEQGAEVYTAATKMDQAKIMHAEAIAMVKRSKSLDELFDVRANNINVPELRAKYEPLGRDAHRLDGLNVYAALVDELHAHPDGDLYHVLETATGARRQPLMFVITTAGDDTASFCYSIREHAAAVLRGSLQDETLFAYIAALDEADDWADERVWAKANPNLGISVKLDSIREQVDTARANPSKQNAVRRYRLNQWVNATTAYVSMDRWAACAGDHAPQAIEQRNEGGLCYGAFDLASVNDVAAWAGLFPHEDEPWETIFRFWIPAEDLIERVHRTKVPYDVWIRDGWLRTTEGPTIDQSQIEEEMIALGDRFQMPEIAYDPWNAGKLVSDLEEDGFRMVKVPGSYSFMSEPTKDLGRRILAGSIRHGGHPVATWMAGNLEVREYEGAIRPVKPKHKMSHKKIDGMVALIMALDRATRNEGAAPSRSVYSERGVLSL